MSRSFRGVLTLAAGLLAATPRPVPAQANQLASASHPFLTVGVGVGGILVAQSGSGPEILITHFAQGDSGWQNNQWSALRPDGRGGYRPVFTSEIQPGNIRELLAGDVIGDARREVVLFLSTGQIVLHDLSSKALIGQFPAAFPADGILAADLEDLNGDGKSELLIVSEDELKVYDGGGALLWGATSGGTDVVGGQMDDDAAIEIAVTSGHVFDSQTHVVQWTWPDGFGHLVEAFDFDSDGREELISAEYWQLLWAFDVERQLPRWSIETEHDIGALGVADTNCDGLVEVLMGDGQWGALHGFDPMSQGELWSVPNPEHGFTNVAAGDADGDGQSEVVCAAGYSHTGKDILYVGDPVSETIEWRSFDLTHAPLGPALGDLDGDGVPEVVSVSPLSESGYYGGRILALDPETLEARAVSDFIGAGFGGAAAFQLANIDTDPAIEIVTSAYDWSIGPIQVWELDPSTNTFSRTWSSSTGVSAPFSALEVVDIDADGELEILAGANGFPTFVYVYSLTTGNPEWNTFQLGAGSGRIDSIVSMLGGGGNPEFAALREDGSVYIFDGVTREAQQIVSGPFTALGRLAGPIRGFWVGRSDGTASRFEKGPTGYASVASGVVGPGRIDGLTELPDGRLAAGSGGRLRVFQSVGGAEIWSSHFYGPKTGRVVVPGHGPGTGLLTTGGSAILRFSPAGPISTVSPESGPAAGGTRITAEDPAVQAGAALYVGSDVTTAISSQNGEVSGDAPVLSPGTLHDVLVVNPDNSLLRSTDAWLVDYLDVPAGDSIHDFVSTISRARVTAGCGGGNFCPDSPVTRAQMAVFLLRGLEGKAFAPNEATGTRFDDVACGDFAAAWIEELSIRQVTAGCGPSSYCPQSGVLREQMAVFLLRTVEGPSYVPPPAQGDFADVPVSSVYAPWIEEIAHRGITAGCGGGNFCPTLVVTRGQMAVFLQSTFGL